MALNSNKQGHDLIFVWEFHLVEPRFRQFLLAQPVVIPLFAVCTVKATVLKSFGFRQTDLILTTTLRKGTATLNFDEQSFAGKLKCGLGFCFHRCSVAQTSVCDSLVDLRLKEA
jgi:hypothetical protein